MPQPKARAYQYAANCKYIADLCEDALYSILCKLMFSVYQSNSICFLKQETDELEDEKSTLQNDIANLLKEKERLEFILAAHNPICKISSSSVSPFPFTSVPEIHSVTTSVVSTTNAPVMTSSSSSLFSNTTSIDSFSSTVKISDLEPSLEESLELLAKAEMETARSVPDVDLSSSLYSQDWEPLYMPANNDLESLCTPVVTCTPACTTYTSSLMFTYPENDVFTSCGPVHRQGSSSNDQSSNSLNSQTLLTLWEFTRDT